MRKLIAALAVAMALTILASEAAMKPTMSERLGLGLVLLLIGLATFVIGWWFPKLARRSTKLATSLQYVALAAVLAIGVSVAVSALTMFLDPHDLRLVLVVLGFGVALAVTVAGVVTRSVTEDLDRITQVAADVEAGRFGGSAGVERRDELGALARRIDEASSRLAEAELGRAKDEEARRRFLADAGHDMRTPLAALQAAIEGLQEGVVADPDRYFAAMASQVETLAALVDDLTLLTAIDAGAVGDQVDVPLAELVGGVIAELEPLANAREVSLLADLGPGGVVRVDEVAFRRALLNVVSNAIEHSPVSGKIVVTTEVSEGTGVVQVRDQGPGFPDDFIVRAFDRFPRADGSRSRPGNGLGLSITKAVVEAHGGEIALAPGAGARVRISVPLSVRGE